MQKDLLNFLGYDAEKIKTIDDFKSAFSKDFVRPDAFKESDSYKAMQGELLGSATGKIKNGFKNLGIEFDAGELKDKPYHEVLSAGLAKLKGQYDLKVSELESKVGQGSTEATKEIELKLEKLQKKYNDTEGLLNATTQEFEKTKGEFANKFKSIKIDNFKKGVFEKVPLLSTISAFEKKGFHDHLSENYLIDFDEDGETPIVKNKNGERIKSDVVTGKFKSFEEVYQEEAKKSNLLQLSKPAQPATRIVVGEQSANGEVRKPFVHPNALK